MCEWYSCESLKEDWHYSTETLSEAQEACFQHYLKENGITTKTED